jgi:hypothetical protein
LQVIEGRGQRRSCPHQQPRLDAALRQCRYQRMQGRDSYHHRRSRTHGYRKHGAQQQRPECFLAALCSSRT